MQPQLAKAAVDTEILIKKVRSGTPLWSSPKLPKQSYHRHIVFYFLDTSGLLRMKQLPYTSMAAAGAGAFHFLFTGLGCLFLVHNPSIEEVFVGLILFSEQSQGCPKTSRCLYQIEKSFPCCAAQGIARSSHNNNCIYRAYQGHTAYVYAEWERLLQ